MRKYIFLLCSVLFSLGMQATDALTDLSNLSNTTAYHIEQLPLSAKGWLYYNSTQPSFVYASATEGSGDAYNWAVYHSENSGSYYLYNLSSGKFLRADGSYCPLTATASPVELKETGTSGEWYAVNSSSLVGMSQTSLSTVLLKNSLGDDTHQLSFIPTSRTLTSAELTTIQKAVAAVETSVPVVNTSSFISDASSLTDGTKVVLYNVGRAKYLYENPITGQLLLNAQISDLGSKDYMFTLHTTDNTNYTFQSGSGKYIPGLKNGDIFTNATSHNFTFTASGTANVWFIKDATQALYFNGNSDAFTGWNATGGNSQYKLCVVTTAAALGAYPLIYNCSATVDGTAINLGTQTTYHLGNTTISAPSITNYTLSSTDKTGTVSAATVVNAVYTNSLTLPFTPTTVSEGSFAADTKWYRIKINGKYLTYTSGSTFYRLTSSTLSSVTNDQLWCFTGNLIDGFKIYNRAAGASRTLGCEIVANGNYPYVGSGMTTQWLLRNNSATSGTYTFTAENTDDIVLPIANNGYDVTSLTTTDNANSSLTFEETTPPTVTAPLSCYTLQSYRAELRSSLDLRMKGYLYTGTSGSTESVKVSTYATTDLSFLWTMEGTGTADSYYLKNLSRNVYMGNAVSRQEVLPSATTPTAYTRAANTTDGTYTFKNANNIYLLDAYSANDMPITGATALTEAVEWYVNPVTEVAVTISSTAMPYASLYLPFATIVPTGMTAYTGIDQGETLLLQAYAKGDGTSTVLPAYTPVILKGEPGTYTFTVTDQLGSAPASNDLRGVYERTARGNQSCYVLGSKNNVPGLYKYTAAYIPAFKAYLPTSTGSSVKQFRFGIATDVEAAPDATLETPAYNLEGKRTTAGKGLYIQNGKINLQR